MVTLNGVVIHNVNNDLELRTVKRAYHRFKLVYLRPISAITARITAGGGEKSDC